MHDSYGSVYIKECNKASNALVATIRAKKAFQFLFTTRSDMDVQLLISAIFKRTPLWDQRDQNHHNRFILDKLWDEVADELKTTRPTVRKKWKTLRDKFRKTLASIPKPKSGDPGDQALVSWEYFESLRFLKDQFTPRMSSGNIPKPSEILPEIDEEDDFDDELSINVMSSEIEDEQDRGASSTLSRPSSLPMSSLPIKRSRKRNSTQDDIGQKLLAIEGKKLQYLQEKNNDKQLENNQNLCFFKSLLPCIEGLSNMQNIEYRMKILKTTKDFLLSLKNIENYALPNPTTPNINSATFSEQEEEEEASYFSL